MGDAVYALFDSVTLATETLHRPTAGTNYLYTWNDETTKNDWRADGGFLSDTCNYIYN